MSDKTKTWLYGKASLYAKGTDVEVPLKGVQVDVEVKDVSSRTVVTQVFENTKPVTVEAVYCFPIEEGAAVNGFEIETGGRTIKGAVEEREKAFERYDRAIEAGDASYLLDRETGDILLISVGNIKPGQEVKARVTYVAELPVSDGVVRLQIQTAVSPRYAPQMSDPVETDRISPPCDQDVPYRLGLTVRVLTSFVTGLSSPSHLVKMVKEGDYTIVTLAEEVSRLDRDFILEISSERRQEPFCILASNDIGDRAALFRFFPDLDEIARGKESRSEVIFVLDCSGSMSGSSIEEAKKALELSLRSLSENDLFNIIRFGSRFELFSENQVAYDGATLNRALKYVHGIHADLGGTELGPAMSHVCSMRKNEGFQRDVLLLTDGEVANTREIISMIAAAKDRMRVFTFGIGYGASHALVKGAARAGRGAWEMIQPGEKIQPKVLRQFSRICQPSLTDVSVTFTGMNAELPRILPPLFEGDSCTLFVRVLDARPDAAVTFTGTCLGRTHSWKAGVGEEVRDDTVPCLWALSRIRELENEDPSDPSTGGSNQLSRRMKGIEKEITDLGLRFNLLTRLTSFVAVEERKGDEKSRGRPEYRRVPVQLTRDWHGIGMGQEIQAGFQTLEMRRTTMHKYITFGKSKRFFGREITLAKERPIMQTTSREHSTSAENVKTEWYLELLDTQQAEGYFTGLNVVAERLNMERRHLTELGDTLDIPDDLLDKNLGRKIIVTLLAVHVLEADPDAKSASGRAIGKAKRWLRRQIALFTAGGTVPQDVDIGSVITVSGKPLKEHLKERFAISI